MATRRVDAVLLTDSSALLSGILTDKVCLCVFVFFFFFSLCELTQACVYGQDIATRVIAEGLRPEQTTVSKVMTRNPMFVTSDTLAIEALQKMVQG